MVSYATRGRPRRFLAPMRIRGPANFLLGLRARACLDEVGSLRGATAAASPRLRGEGRAEGAFPQAQTRGEPPSPGSRKRDPTSPRKRGAVKKASPIS